MCRSFVQHNPIWFSARNYHADREGDPAAKLLAQNSSLSSWGVFDAFFICGSYRVSIKAVLKIRDTAA